MQHLARRSASEARGAANGSGPALDTGQDLARPGGSESPGEGNCAVEVLPPRKPPGRPLGSKNKVTRELRAIAQRYSLRACRKLWKLANEGKTEEVQLRACTELLDRGHGKPTQTQLVGGTGGAPLLIDFLRSLPDDQ